MTRIDNSDRILDWYPAHDPQNLNYPMRTSRRTTRPRRRTHYLPGGRIDQGPDGACVSFGMTNMMQTWPQALSILGVGKRDKEVFAAEQYRHFQRRDEWRDAIQGSDFGTSTNAGAGTLKAAGAIGEYRWHFTMGSIIDTLSLPVRQGGGVVGVGTKWLDGMFDCPPGTLADATGPEAGGHFYVLTGYHSGIRLFREGWTNRHEAIQITNSWGNHWGLSGKAWIKVEDMAMLLADRGEAVSFINPKQHTIQRLIEAERALPSIAGQW